MFRIRFFTPAVNDESGWRHAGAELVLGRGCLPRGPPGLGYPGVRAAVAGRYRAPGPVCSPQRHSMTAYRGAGEEPHLMWALWRDQAYVYVQEHPVVPAELDAPFDPRRPYEHVGDRIPASEHGLAIPEWRLDLTDPSRPTWGSAGPSDLSSSLPSQPFVQ